MYITSRSDTFWIFKKHRSCLYITSSQVYTTITRTLVADFTSQKFFAVNILLFDLGLVLSPAYKILVYIFINVEPRAMNETMEASGIDKCRSLS